MIYLHRVINVSIDFMFMQKRIFLPLYFKYFDSSNPAFESAKIMQCRLRNKRTRIYDVLYQSNNADECKSIGYVILRFDDNTATIGRIGILKKYRNQGLGSQVIEELERRFSNYKIWRLDTIKQDKRNCHFYEKSGYIPCGTERIVNKRMTMIDYEKRK